MTDDDGESLVRAMADALIDAKGVVAVALGGSRARGTESAASDGDVGVYYRGVPDIGELVALAEEFTGQPVDVAGPGGWGP